MPLPLAHKYRIDWMKVLLNLRSTGMSCAAIARLVGCDEAVLQRLARGETAETLFSICAALLDLHERICAPQHDLDALLKRTVEVGQQQRAA